MKLVMIAACDNAWGIGRDNKLAWSEPADLAHFRERTMHQHLIMGRKTFNGLPRKLNGRTIHVLSRRTDGEGIQLVDALQIARDQGAVEILVAGGGEIYRQLEPLCDYAEITRVPGNYNCDTFMPDLNRLGWKKFGEKSLTDTLNVEYWRKS